MQAGNNPFFSGRVNMRTFTKRNGRMVTRSCGQYGGKGTVPALTVKALTRPCADASRRGGRVVTLMLFLIITGLGLATAQSPTPCYPLPTPTSPPPTPTQINYDNLALGTVKYVETMWESVGSRFPLKPRTGPRAGTDIYITPTPAPSGEPMPTPGFIPGGLGPVPAIDASSANGPNPNDYSVLSVQGVYQKDMWSEPHLQENEFARPVIFMLGSRHLSMASLTSGVGKTRSGDIRDDQIAERESKSVIGLLSQGILLRGGSAYDALGAIGSEHIGFVARHNEDSCECRGYRAEVYQDKPCFHPSWTPPTPTRSPTLEEKGWDFHQRFLTLVQGAEILAQLGKRVTVETREEDGQDDTKWKLHGPFDWRHQQWREDDLWNFVPAVVEHLISVDSYAKIDNRKAQDESKASIPPFGKIREAIGIQGNIIAQVKDSFINVQIATGIVIKAFSTNTFRHPCISDGNVHGDDVTGCNWVNTDTAGSVIRDYVGIEVTCPNVPPEIELTSSNAMTIWATPLPTGTTFPTITPTASPTEGETKMEAGIADTGGEAGKVRDIEKYATLIARGDVIVGDIQPADTSATGFDAGVLYVNGVLRLKARTEPPTFAANVAPSDRVGLMYFDATRNCLRVSVAAPREGLQRTDWKEAEIVWVDVKLNTKTLNPLTDVKGARPGRASMASASREEVLRGIERAKQTALAGNSVFLKSRRELMAQTAKDPSQSRTVQVAASSEKDPSALPEQYQPEPPAQSQDWEQRVQSQDREQRAERVLPQPLAAATMTR